ncbi:protein SRC2 homolog [Salvia miltiorrhiza]|uniref:protein SRC2 homolog n=1 Tax=Salvia miltiorrhiza TaxID=226208 RepID=UPI0025ABE86A|nr:protein SRC2 homolog [Salvia miltiorrhiza]
MECRKLEITLVSAQHLPDVRTSGRMKVYAKVSLKGESKTTKKSHVDYEGGTNPRWNFVAHYTVSESTVRRPGLSVTVKLVCRRTLGDRFVGKVKIPVKSLFDMGQKSRKILSYDVAGGGRLNLLYSFSDRMFVRQPSSGWKTAFETVGFLVLVGGAMLLLAGDSDRDEDGDDC